jgi:hypothetical protein
VHTPDDRIHLVVRPMFAENEEKALRSIQKKADDQKLDEMKKSTELAHKQKQIRDSFQRRRQHQHHVGERALKNSNFIPSRSGTPYIPSRSDTPESSNNERTILFSSPPPTTVSVQCGPQPAVISSLDLKGLLCADAAINFEDLKMKINGGLRQKGSATPDITSRRIHTSRQEKVSKGSTSFMRPSSAPASKVRGRNHSSTITPKLNTAGMEESSKWANEIEMLDSSCASRTLQNEIEAARDDMEKFEMRVRRNKLVDMRGGAEVFSLNQV